MIREIEHSDIERIMQIWLEGNMEAHSFIPAEYWKSNAALVQEQLLRAEVYVYEDNGIIQGFAGTQGNYLAGIFIEKSVRSAGIGKQLLDHIKGIRSLLFLNVYQENRRAITFYQREGLIITSENLDEDTGHYEYTMTWEQHIHIRPYQETDFTYICKIHDSARRDELALSGLADAFPVACCPNCCPTDFPQKPLFQSALKNKEKHRKQSFSVLFLVKKWWTIQDSNL